jgi:DNA-binding response OmpR family regulator
MRDQPTDTHELRFADIAHVWREHSQPRPSQAQDRTMAPTSYRARLGRETVQLDTIAFRILTFLAATPYRAFTRRRIAEAVSSRRYPVAEETLDQHIKLLRDQLGFFRDYVQSVPYIGYRFKA